MWSKCFVMLMTAILIVAASAQMNDEGARSKYNRKLLEDAAIFRQKIAVRKQLDYVNYQKEKLEDELEALDRADRAIELQKRKNLLATTSGAATEDPYQHPVQNVNQQEDRDYKLRNVHQQASTSRRKQ